MLPSILAAATSIFATTRSGEFWSPSWQPTQHKLEDYSCRHGMGYTTIGSQYSGIEASTRYFVPLDENLEIWQLTVTNHRAQAAELSVFSSVEFCLWDAQDDSTNFQRNFSIGQVEIEDGVIYHKTEYRERRDHFALLCLLGETRRLRHAARGLPRPLSRLGQSRRRRARPARPTPSPTAGRPIGSHHVKLALKPGESRQIVFVLGYHENPQDEKFDPPDSQTINKKTVQSR